MPQFPPMYSVLSVPNTSHRHAFALIRVFASPLRSPGPSGYDDTSPSPWVGWHLFLSLLGMLNLPLAFTITTGMDQYGLFTVDVLAARPLPLVLSVAISTVLAIAAGGSYRWLWNRQSWFVGSSWGPFRRSLMLTGPPVVLAFAPMLALTSDGGKPTVIVVLVLIMGSLCIASALRDRHMTLDSASAQSWLNLAISVIVVLLALSIAGMFMLYYIDQEPAQRNLFWQWHYNWSDLGYPAEDFGQRQREGLAIFTIIGSTFMIGVPGTAMLDAIWRWTRHASGAVMSSAGAGEPGDESPANAESAVQIQEPVEVGSGPEPHLPSCFATPEDAPIWVARLCEKLETLPQGLDGSPSYTLQIAGHTVNLFENQRMNLIADRDSMLAGADLLIDRVAGLVYTWLDDGWSNVGIDAGPQDRPYGPFALLGVYAEHPGNRFTSRELEILLGPRMKFRDKLNVRSYIYQLRRREAITIESDVNGTYMPEWVKVCILDRVDDRSA